METEVRYSTKQAGRVEAKLLDISQDMLTGALSALASHGILLSGQGRTGLQRAIQGQVTGSSELMAAVARMIEQGHSPEAA